MKCPNCGTPMGDEGICPSCGHLVVEMDDSDADLSPPPNVQGPAQTKTGSPQAFSPPTSGDTLEMTGSRDFSIWLLGVVVYSVLLHPTLAYLVFWSSSPERFSVLAAAFGYIPVAYVITRLMCFTNPENGRLQIRNEYLRGLFRRLNAIVIRMS
ncbi:MAG: TFIIB-type zinc ribbon-containing protein [Armatimonadota bacterium]